jgi:hypothetical protein
MADRKDRGSERRAFLKTVGVATAVGAAAWGINRGLEAVRNQEPNLTPADYEPIPHDSLIALDLEGIGKLTPVRIQYLGVEPIQARKQNLSLDEELNLRVYTPVSFNPGGENERLAGELLDMRLYKVSLNSDLDRAGVYRDATGTENMDVERIDNRDVLPGQTVWGLKVAVYPHFDIFPGGRREYETNPHSNEHMAQGWAVCDFDPRNNFLFVKGYVKNQDVLVEAA